MATYEKTGLRDKYPSLYHRILGKKCLMTDIDRLELSNGLLEDKLIEYEINSGKTRVVAIIDNKRANRNKDGSTHLGNTPRGTLSRRRDIANQLSVPFYVVITYLDPDWKNKQYFVIPMNWIAKDRAHEVKWNQSGKMMSLSLYSQFQHKLRDKTWDPKQIIDSDCIFDVFGTFDHMTLDDLSKSIKQYGLPKLDNIYEVQQEEEWSYDTNRGYY